MEGKRRCAHRIYIPHIGGTEPELVSFLVNDNATKETDFTATRNLFSKCSVLHFKCYEDAGMWAFIEILV